nr:MAG TPA: hypothetical protein [Caudoviricetes sp.]
MSEYKYAFNKDDLYTGQCASIEEALADARQDAEFYPEGDRPHLVYIGRYKPFKPMIDADGVIEVLQREAYDAADDAAVGWLENLTPEEIESLGESLTRAFRRWAREYGEEPYFGEVHHIKRYDLWTGREI